jgi:hypothetical protein
MEVSVGFNSGVRRAQETHKNLCFEAEKAWQSLRLRLEHLKNIHF